MHWRVVEQCCDGLWDNAHGSENDSIPAYVSCMGYGPCGAVFQCTRSVDVAWFHPSPYTRNMQSAIGELNFRIWSKEDSRRRNASAMHSGQNGLLCSPAAADVCC